jgi:RNA polymerase sigma-70 factor (ECF subfamily)
MTQSDDELIAAVAAGDREAFGALYRRRRPVVYRFALHMTGRPAVAEDVAQDVFVTVIHEARRFQVGRSGVVAWLLGIARNYARRRLAEPRHDGLSDPQDEPRQEDDPVGAIDRERQMRDLRKALEDLPVVYREAVVLCDLEELSYADAAAAAHCPIGTLRSRLHRGRTLLSGRMRCQRADARRRA